MNNGIVIDILLKVNILKVCREKKLNQWLIY